MADQEGLEATHCHGHGHRLPPEPATGRTKVVFSGDVTKPTVRRHTCSTHTRTTTSPLRVLCIVLLAVLAAGGVAALALYLVYRPSRPSFAVTAAAVYALYNATSLAPATAVAASLQFTLAIRNPNGRAAARYDRLTAYASYRGEAVTLPTPLPPVAQDPGSTVAVSPVLGAGEGAPVPVSPATLAALAADETYGVVALRVVVLGRVRFVSGPFRSAAYGLYVRCDVLVGVRKGTNAGKVPLLGDPDCDVDM